MVLVAIFPSKGLAGVYTWTDDSGVVHFSQMPPQHTVTKVQKLQGADASVFSPRPRGGQWYCGDQPIPTLPSGSLDIQIQFLKQFRAQMEKTLYQTERSLREDSKRMDRSPESGMPWGQKIQEYKCVLTWVDAALEHRRSGTYHEEQARLKKRYQKLSMHKEVQCPMPVGGMLIGPDAQTWSDCNEEVEDEMRAIETRLDELERLMP